MADITNVLNTILDNASTEYQTRVPQATRENIADVGNPILSYSALQNEFLNALVNKIAFTEVQAKIWENPLAILKKGNKPLGYDIENVHTNPAKAEVYTRDGTNLLLTKTPDVKSEYFRVNRQDKYKVTIYESDLEHAFTSYENMASLIDSIVNSLYSGDYIDEFILMKNTFADGVLNQKMITAGTDELTSEANAKSFLTDVKNISSAMTYPSTALNGYAKAGGSGNPIMTWTPKDDQILIVRSDILNYLDVNVLAAAFNIDKAEFMGRVVQVDSFGRATKVNAILADKNLLRVYDDKTRLTDFFNGESMYINYWWHHWQTYALSMFANAVAFVTDTTAPAAPVITAPAATDTEVSGTGEVEAVVFVTIGDETLTAVVDASGDWTVTGFTAMTQGDTVTAYQVDGAGNKSVSDSETVTA